MSQAAVTLDPNRSKQLILVLLVDDIVDEEHQVSYERRMLTEADREEISRGIAENLEGEVIAERIGRSPGVVSREIARHGGRAHYRAVVAQRAATEARPISP